MTDYKEALKLGIRFQTTKGLLSTEQLWGLSQTDLSNLIKIAKKDLNKNEDNELSFLEEGVKTVNKEAQLRFDILKDIYLSKQADMKAIRDEAETKAHNQKILALIAKKQENSLEEMSVEELTSILENAKKQKQTPLQELLDYHKLTEEDFNKLSGFEKECKVVAFYNKGWKPNWEDINERKYIPYFYMCNFGLDFVDYICSISICSPRLYFKKEDDAEEAVEKYFEIFKQSRTEI